MLFHLFCLVKGSGVYEDFGVTITPVPFYANGLTTEKDTKDLAAAPSPGEKGLSLLNSALHI